MTEDRDTILDEEIARVATLDTMGLVNQEGGSTLQLLANVHEFFEQCPSGAAQVLAHAIMLGELFAMLDHMPQAHLWTFDDRMRLLTAQIKRAYELAHEARGKIIGKKKVN